MNRKTATLVGASVALAAGSAFAAAPATEASPPPVASSYAELLQPIPNAVERLKASNAEAAAQPRLIEAQYAHHHHHHHHHHHNRAWYLQNGYVWLGGAWVLHPRRHHHHHHHHN
jgi:hypothetical protein